MNDLEKKEKKKKYLKEYYQNNKEYQKEYQKKYRLENKEKISKEQKKYSLENKEKLKENKKEYYQNNKEKLKKQKKEYQKVNKEKIKEQRNIYQKERRKTDPLFKLKCSIGNLILLSIRNNNYTKKSKTFEILGCSHENFKSHLERQFTNGMSWENQGKWHLDHIYPVSLAKDEQELIKLNHYTNFQPMWAIENIIKSNKVIPNTQTKLI